MSCTEIRERLDDYADGLLGEAEFQDVELHLHSCEACREEERLLRSLLAQAAALPPQVAPGRDLWPDVAQRIGGRRWRALPFGWSRRTTVWSSLAAAAVVVLALGAINGWERRPEAGISPDVPPGATLVSTDAGGSGLLAAEREYARATNVLMAALHERRASLPPETLAVLERDLRTIDEALAELRAALKADPSHPQLNHLLASTHQKKLNVLRQVVKLTT